MRKNRQLVTRKIRYDIVAKGHNGTIEINSKEGAFTEFKISLPV